MAQAVTKETIANATRKENRDYIYFTDFMQKNRPYNTLYNIREHPYLLDVIDATVYKYHEDNPRQCIQKTIVEFKCRETYGYDDFDDICIDLKKVENLQYRMVDESANCNIVVMYPKDKKIVIIPIQSDKEYPYTIKYMSEFHSMKNKRYIDKKMVSFKLKDYKSYYYDFNPLHF